MGGGGNIDACCTLKEGVDVFWNGRPPGDYRMDGEREEGRGKEEGKGAEGDADGEAGGEGLWKEGELEIVVSMEGKGGAEGKETAGELDPEEEAGGGAG